MILTLIFRLKSFQKTIMLQCEIHCNPISSLIICKSLFIALFKNVCRLRQKKTSTFFFVFLPLTSAHFLFVHLSSLCLLLTSSFVKSILRPLFSSSYLLFCRVCHFSLSASLLYVDRILCGCLWVINMKCVLLYLLRSTQTYTSPSDL